MYNYWYPNSALAANIWARELGDDDLRNTERGLVLPARPRGRERRDWVATPVIEKIQRPLCKWLREQALAASDDFVQQLSHKLRLAGIDANGAQVLEMIAQLRAASRLAPERAVHAVVRTIVNGWPTRARFGMDRRCVFCNQMDIANGIRDDVKHYRNCRAVCLLLSSLLSDPSNTTLHLDLRASYCLGLPNCTAVMRHIFVMDVLDRIFCVMRHSNVGPSEALLLSLARARVRQAATHSRSSRQFLELHLRFLHSRRTDHSGSIIQDNG